MSVCMFIYISARAVDRVLLSSGEGDHLQIIVLGVEDGPGSAGMKGKANKPSSATAKATSRWRASALSRRNPVRPKP